MRRRRHVERFALDRQHRPRRQVRQVRRRRRTSPTFVRLPRGRSSGRAPAIRRVFAISRSNSGRRREARGHWLACRQRRESRLAWKQPTTTTRSDWHDENPVGSVSASASCLAMHDRVLFGRDRMLSTAASTENSFPSPGLWASYHRYASSTSAAAAWTGETSVFKPAVPNGQDLVPGIPSGPDRSNSSAADQLFALRRGQRYRRAGSRAPKPMSSGVRQASGG